MRLIKGLCFSLTFLDKRHLTHHFLIIVSFDANGKVLGHLFYSILQVPLLRGVRGVSKNDLRRIRF